LLSPSDNYILPGLSAKINHNVLLFKMAEICRAQKGKPRNGAVFAGFGYNKIAFLIAPRCIDGGKYEAISPSVIFKENDSSLVRGSHKAVQRRSELSTAHAHKKTGPYGPVFLC